MLGLLKIYALRCLKLAVEARMKYTLILVMGLAFILSGCNTIQGAGEDIESGGEAIQDTAENVKKKM